MKQRKPTLTFGDALKRHRATAFGAMIKPVGATCNLDCTYCYYLDKELQAPKVRPTDVMSDELLEEFIQQYIQGNQVPVVSFCWHGGEPLLAGLDFFRRAMELQQKYKGEATASLFSCALTGENPTERRTNGRDG